MEENEEDSGGLNLQGLHTTIQVYLFTRYHMPVLYRKWSWGSLWRNNNDNEEDSGIFAAMVYWYPSVEL